MHGQNISLACMLFWYYFFHNRCTWGKLWYYFKNWYNFYHICTCLILLGIFVHLGMPCKCFKIGMICAYTLALYREGLWKWSEYVSLQPLSQWWNMQQLSQLVWMYMCPRIQWLYLWTHDQCHWHEAYSARWDFWLHNTIYILGNLIVQWNPSIPDTQTLTLRTAWGVHIILLYRGSFF